jgi:hypothetical protein
MSYLSFYLTRDHRARSRTALIAIFSGTVAGAAAEWLWDLSTNHAAIACLATIGVVEIARAATYRIPDKTTSYAVTDFSFRRNLIQAGMAAAGITVMTLLRVPRVAASTIQKDLLAASANPTSPQSLRETGDALRRAKAAGIRIAPGKLAEAGERFIKATDSSDAWTAAQRCLDYRSFLNDGTAPRLHNPRQSFSMFFRLEVGPDGTIRPPEVLLFGSASRDRAAIFEPIVPPHLGDYKHQLEEADFVAVNFLGQIIRLDGLHLKNVLLRNTRVRYWGGSIVLENVYFINCQFDLRNNEAGREFAMHLLTQSPTEFRFLA